MIQNVQCTYIPQTSGMVEGTNTTIKPQLSKLSQTFMAKSSPFGFFQT